MSDKATTIAWLEAHDALEMAERVRRWPCRCDQCLPSWMKSASTTVASGAFDPTNHTVNIDNAGYANGDEPTRQEPT